jgi:glycosyltransferase involved in cell wall biosynthesis
MARVSVIIPTHDRPARLPQAIASARAAGRDVEIIVVDDASTDETANVCQRLDGIRYIRVERNQGVAGARNIGIFESRAPYIAFLDDDDVRLPGSLDLQADLLDQTPAAGFVCGAMIMANQDRQPTGEIIRPRHPGGDAFWELLELDFPVLPLSALIRKECFIRVGLLNSRISGIDDWDIFTRIAEIYPVVTTQVAVGIYRQPTPSSAQGSSARAAQLRSALRHQTTLLRLRRAADLSARRQQAIRRRAIDRVCETLIWTAVNEHLQAGRLRPALENLGAALVLDPFFATRPGMREKAANKLRAKFSSA